MILLCNRYLKRLLSTATLRNLLRTGTCRSPVGSSKHVATGANDLQCLQNEHKSLPTRASHQCTASGPVIRARTAWEFDSSMTWAAWMIWACWEIGLRNCKIWKNILLQSQAAFTGLKRGISGLAARVAFHHRNDIRVKLARLAALQIRMCSDAPLVRNMSPPWINMKL